LALGHRRIDFVCFSLEHTGQKCRFLGYQTALNEWNISSDPSLVCELDELPDENLEALHQYLTSPNRPTAIVALNDYLAVKIINLCGNLAYVFRMN
jgi:LacI family transcriptional regulator